MRKFFPSFMGILTLSWIVGGTIWCNHNFCHSVELQHTASIVTIKEGNPTTPFFFQLASIQPIFVGESISVLKKTTDYLNENKNKVLLIKGLYSSKERQIFPQTDLGIYRADAIKSALTSLGAGSEKIKIISELRNDLHFINNQLTDGIEFQVMNNPYVSFQGLNVYFLEDKYKFKLSADLADYFNRLKRFLAIYPTKKVKIIAYFPHTEGERSIREISVESRSFSEKRLSFMKYFLENQEFDLNKFQFECKKNGTTKYSPNDIKKQRIEIRLV